MVAVVDSKPALVAADNTLVAVSVLDGSKREQVVEPDAGNRAIAVGSRNCTSVDNIVVVVEIRNISSSFS